MVLLKISDWWFLSLYAIKWMKIELVVSIYGCYWQPRYLRNFCKTLYIFMTLILGVIYYKIETFVLYYNMWFESNMEKTYDERVQEILFPFFHYFTW